MNKSKIDILQLFINNIAQFVFWKDKDSVYQGCNTNFAKYAGYETTSEISGKTDYDMAWSKEEADFFRKIDQEVMNYGIPQLNFEEQQTLSDGSTKWLSTSKIPLSNDENKVVGILGWYFDITPYKTMQLQIDEKENALLHYSQQLEKSNRALEMANGDLEMFTYAVSHDLKSPIRSILGLTDLIIKAKANSQDKETLKMLNFVLNSGKRMNNLVDDILSFARAGLQKNTAEQIWIKRNILDKLSDLDQLVLNTNVNVKLDFSDCLIFCYPDLLGLVFYNLVSNGLKYNESEKPTVKCTMEEQSTKFIFSISDNGIGINSEFQETIFQPFERLHSSEIEGSGLGLSICKRIIELHNGKIWVDNNSQKGTSIKFTISKSLN